MKGFNLVSVASLVAAICLLGASAQAGLPTVVASDNADNAGYAPQPTHNYTPINGGFGYNLWTIIGFTDGGTFMEGTGVNGRHVEPLPTSTTGFSFALYGGNSGGGQDSLSRPLSSVLAAGEFDIRTRFDINGDGNNLISIRSGNNTSSFGGGELLSFGIVNSNLLSYTDSTGFHVLPSGEARGGAWKWSVDFDAAAGTYSATVTNLEGTTGLSFSGGLEASATTVGSFAVTIGQQGNGQNLIFDVPEFSVIPEPSTIALVGFGLLGALVIRRRKA
jgi:hypothetical protein